MSYDRDAETRLVYLSIDDTVECTVSTDSSLSSVGFRLNSTPLPLDQLTNTTMTLRSSSSLTLPPSPATRLTSRVLTVPIPAAGTPTVLGLMPIPRGITSVANSISAGNRNAPAVHSRLPVSRSFETLNSLVRTSNCNASTETHGLPTSRRSMLPATLITVANLSKRLNKPLRHSNTLSPPTRPLHPHLKVRTTCILQREIVNLSGLLPFYPYITKIEIELVKSLKPSSKS